MRSQRRILPQEISFAELIRLEYGHFTFTTGLSNVSDPDSDPRFF